MPEIKTTTRTSLVTTRVERKLNYCEIGAKGLVAYRLTSDTLRKSKRGKGKEKSKVSTKVTEGFTFKKDIDSFLGGKKDTFPESAYRMVTDEYLEFARHHGWIMREPDDHRIYEGMNEINTPLTYLEKGTPLANVIRIDGSNNMIYDIEDRALPVAVLCDYGEAQMNNGFYDLEKAVQILRERGDVTFYPERDPAPSGFEDNPIGEIPYYNADTNRTRCVRFIWAPSVDAYRQMVDLCAERDKRYTFTTHNKHRAVFDLDLLGLRAGGAAKFQDFYGRVSDDSEDDEYDPYDDY